MFGFFQREESDPSKDWEVMCEYPRKKALLVGLNYVDTPDELDGCENDTNMMEKRLKDMGYDITIMRDEDVKEGSILESMKAMFKGSKSGDKYVFHYSGHGSSVDDKGYDETDGKDEVLCEGNRYVLDDDINEVLRDLPEGVTVIMIIDACCSGSIADLQHRFFFGRYLVQESEKNVKANVILLSGCEDEDTSSETVEDGKSFGALTYEFCNILDDGNHKSYSWLLLSGIISSRLNVKGFTQRPQLSTSKISLMMEKVCF